MKDIAFSLLDIQELVSFVFQLSLRPAGSDPRVGDGLA